VLAEAASSERWVPMGAGRVGDRLFLANAGAGVDALALAHVEARPGLKRRLGPLWFAAATLRVAMSREQRAGGRVLVDAVGVPTRGAATASEHGEPHPTDRPGRSTLHLEAELVAVLHTGPYTYLGPWPLTLTPGNAIRRGLALVALRRLGARQLAATLPGVLRDGLTGSPHAGVAALHCVEHARLSPLGSDMLRYQVDGEPASTAAPIDLRYEEDALRLVDPRRLSLASTGGRARGCRPEPG
jgi:diacylglycerol kinase family enzyme